MINNLHIDLNVVLRFSTMQGIVVATEDDVDDDDGWDRTTRAAVHDEIPCT